VCEREKTNKCASCWSSHINKYKDLGIEVSMMWKVGEKFVPVTNGALGTIKKGLVKKLQLLPGHPSAT
jgi:hypothetical protein